MTPGARVAAAIAVLDQWLAGASAEQALTGWARGNRFAGSSDRAVIRDHVYQAIRRRDSYALSGGALTGRGLMLGWARSEGAAIDALFDGQGYAPPPLSDAEKAHEPALPSACQSLDWPEWLWPEMAGYGDATEAILRAMQDRAPVFLRVNLLKTDVASTIARLADEEISARPHPLAATALEVTGNARRIGQSATFRDGDVELQDAASQAVAALCGAAPGDRVLDYCAGGGGKTLALAARTRARVDAHDASPARMKTLPERARRAGAQVQVLDRSPGPGADYDLVFCDVPCSGSGSWRRDPEGKWRLTPERLGELPLIQLEILRQAIGHVRPGGHLFYATCSLFQRENGAVVDKMIQSDARVRRVRERQFTPLDGADGFYCALLKIA